MGLEVFAAIVSEFAPGTASELGTTWERHEAMSSERGETFFETVLRARVRSGETVRADGEGERWERSGGVRGGAAVDERGVELGF